MLETENLLCLKDFNDTPILFVGNNVEELNLTKDGIREILESFNTYKDYTVPAIDVLPTEEHLEEIEEGVQFLEDPLEMDENIIPEPAMDKSVKRTKKDSKPVTLKTQKANSRFKSKYHKTLELEKLSKQKSLAVSLSAYLDCCVSNGMLNRGFVTLLNYRYKYKKYSSTATKINEISLFNILLHGYAEKENFLKVKEILSLIKEDQIQFNEQTFAAVFECLGRISNNPASFTKNQIKDNNEIRKHLQQYHADAVSQNISLNDIMDKSIFIRDQRDIVLYAIEMIDNRFNVQYSSPKLDYDNKLLNALNKNVRNIDFNMLECQDAQPGSEIMNSKSGFTRQQLENFTKEQLSNELTGYVTVKSIQKFEEPNQIILHYVSFLKNPFINKVINKAKSIHQQSE